MFEFDVSIFLMTTLGIILSIILPLLRAQLPSAGNRSVTNFKTYAKPYLIVGLFSILTSLLVLAFVYTPDLVWRDALLAGYAWDSTLQKLTQKD
ncbi:MAG: hypothetical protein AAFX55_12435 [Bacteroidota bacterium]